MIRGLIKVPEIIQICVVLMRMAEGWEKQCVGCVNSKDQYYSAKKSGTQWIPQEVGPEMQKTPEHREDFLWPSHIQCKALHKE